MHQDPTLSEHAQALGISTEWLRRKMRQVGVTGYQDGRCKRLSPTDRAKLMTVLNPQQPQPNNPTDTQTETPIIPTEIPQSSQLAPIVEVIEAEPVQALALPEIRFESVNYSGAITQLASSVQNLQTRSELTFDAYERNLINNAAQRGVKVGLAAQQAYHAGIDHAMAIGLGKKPEEGAA